MTTVQPPAIKPDRRRSRWLVGFGFLLVCGLPVAYLAKEFSGAGIRFLKRTRDDTDDYQGKGARNRFLEMGYKLPEYMEVQDLKESGHDDFYLTLHVIGQKRAQDVVRDLMSLNPPLGWDVAIFEYDALRPLSVTWKDKGQVIEQECFHDANEDNFYFYRTTVGTEIGGWRELRGDSAKQELARHGLRLPPYATVWLYRTLDRQSQDEIIFEVGTGHKANDVVRDMWTLNPPTGWDLANLDKVDGSYRWDSSEGAGVTQECYQNPASKRFRFNRGINTDGH